ncbi:hypothetical protein [Priestia koreensis]|uniref:hypothetical protein n=1 Tax=Priestia koreensis TaxID=284581 RepID=UPI001F567B01|nr:hypothetical protein [Priestia koreensis]UNL86949.1 hypothetical protein IE339_10870 [Priestia koreensis]
MKKLDMLSVFLFIISIVVLGFALFTTVGDLFSGPVMIVICVIFPIIGLFIALKSHKSTLKVFGIAGNSFVLLFSVVVPLASTFFWNQP